MTDSPASPRPDGVPADIPDDRFVSALSSTLPDAMAVRRRGWVWVAVIVAVTVGVLALLLAIDEESIWPMYFMAILICGIGIGRVDRWVRGRQEVMIVPHIAEAAGLRYSKQADHFLSAMPDRLLPTGRERSAEDHVHGVVGGRQFGMAEAKIATGGKNSTMQFKGIVARVENVVPLPPFFVAEASKTRKDWFGYSRLSTDGLEEVSTVRGASQGDFTVWAQSAAELRDNPALAAVLDVLLNPGPRIAVGIRLFSATTYGNHTHIALRHDRDLFRIGGLLARDYDLNDGIKRAAVDLQTPMAILGAILEAERAVSGQRA